VLDDGALTGIAVGGPIDTSFDAKFAARRSLPWWPWIGARFTRSLVRTMILGESVYDWDPKIGAAKRRYARADGLRITHGNHALNPRRDSPYVRNIERAIFLRRYPSDVQVRELWASVAYHNLVLRPMQTAKNRPAMTDYVSGWTEWLDLAALLGIEQCIAYGLEAHKIEALRRAARARQVSCVVREIGPSIGRHRARMATIEGTGISVRVLFIRHPSAFFSWRAWGQLIREHVESLGEQVLPVIHP